MIEVYSSGLKILFEKDTVFSGGEVHIKLKNTPYDRHGVFHVRATLTSSEEVMKLLMVTDAIRRKFKPETMALMMLYVPYSRQDRVCDQGEALGARVFCDLINSLNYDKVYILSPHSDVVPSLLNNVHDITDSFEKKVLVELTAEGHYVLCAPDAGAEKRTMSFAKLAGKDMFTATKTRDVTTGRITDTRVNVPHGGLSGQTVVIYDDLCDYGGTFIELAKILKEDHSASRVVLVVAHGILKGGFGKISKHIDRVIVSDSFPFDKSNLHGVELTEIRMN
jgi:ribose-phosphate pyrophosphokinase